MKTNKQRVQATMKEVINNVLVKNLENNYRLEDYQHVNNILT